MVKTAVGITSLIGFLILVATVAVGALGFAPKSDPVPVAMTNTRVGELGPMELEDDNNHAFAGHGAEAAQTRNCLNNYGIKQVFVERPNFQVHFLCEDPFTKITYDWIGLWDKVKQTWRQKTGYSPKSGEWSDVIRYLKAKNNIPGQGGKLMNPEHLWKYLEKNSTLRWVR